ncbi:MAG: transcription-repair coupling factor [Lachnospiraceae bacterium]|nr:transcription-repair coupling factor [Lachnospiraceae bacterium]
MNILTKPIEELSDYETVIKTLKNKGCVAASGCVESQKIHIAEGLSDGFQCKIIATYSDIRVKEIAEDLRQYERNVYVYPAKDLIFYQADIHSNKLVTDRLRVMRRIEEGGACAIVTTFDALMSPMLPLDTYRNSRIGIDKKNSVDLTALASKLVEIGYIRNHQVEEPGQFSIRGDIIDVFDTTETNPFRIELWGDDVESIRSFDIDSQRSIEELESVNIFPAAEVILSEEMLRQGLERIEKEAVKQSKAFRDEFKTEEAHRIDVQVRTLKEDILELGRVINLDSYVRYFYDDLTDLASVFDKDRTLFILDEPIHIEEHIKAVELEFAESMKARAEKGYVLPGQMNLLNSAEHTRSELIGKSVLELSALETKALQVPPDYRCNITAKSISPYKNQFDYLLKDLQLYKKRGYRIILLCPSVTRAGRLCDNLRDNDIMAVYTDDPLKELVNGEVVVMSGHLRRGFEYPLLKFVVISESDIFGAEKKKVKHKKKYEGTRIQDFNDLKVGDYVVHENHGLGVYRGIEKIESENVIKDYMKISYRDGGNLYVLATAFDAVQKYASSDAARKPKLNKLGTKEWSNTKSKVRSAVDVVAKDLVELYAIRQSKKGFEFGPDTVWQKEFEETFPFEETEDQLAAIADTKADMESSRIMDRLICGDVGYGKTEIAIRAAFKAVTEGKQVAVLVPTTILAQQHYNTFTQRMKDYPVRIQMLSRFRSAREQKETISELEKGMVDIVIGTHRLLSDDVHYKDLGLLVVDEEQRFGVTHKEKIKKMKDNVDVLTLSATPIPRTLHMSLVGIRDMSVLEEAPGDRIPIQTFVMEYNEEMVREAIVREIARGGQVYYVYNRVSDIADMTARLRELIPEANIAYGHGQMKERELEQLMYDFIDGQIDVLVATTIVETGLDISNVNTIIIHDSDRMGLSQLYQLRGRVGRSNRTAYAFLMYKRDKILKETAEKRLEAIREYTDLGSGFKIAMRDLEIRGAGNMLGRTQHGHMEAVGYDLYCKMLNDAVRRRKGMSDETDEFETQIDLDVDAYIPAEYILNEVQKLDIYKRIAVTDTVQEAADMKEELKDRFGNVPRSVDNLIRVSLLRSKAHTCYVTELKGGRDQVKLIIKRNADLDPSGIPELLTDYKGRLQFVAKGDPYFLLGYRREGVIEKDEETLLCIVDKLLDDIKMSLHIG